MPASDLKISEMPEKFSLGDDDLIPVVDFEASTPTTSKIKLQNARTTLTGPQGPQGEQGDPGDSYIWRSAWVTATTYAVNDCVSYNGNGYVCLIAHTSGVFATDLGNLDWSMFIQKGETGATGATGAQGATGANVDLLYGTSDTPPGGSTPDGTLYVKYTE